MDYNLERFRSAQQNYYQTALQEIKAGQKHSHWMWFIFPQIAGLGYSEMARYYAIRDMDEAKAYMEDDMLGQNLVEISEALLETESSDAQEVMGWPDNLKLKSSMTLFALAKPECEVFQKVLDKFFHGEPDQKTVEILCDSVYAQKVIGKRKDSSAMSNTVKIRNLILGEGIPKICVPVMGRTRQEIVYSVRNAMEQGPDMIEWRADFLEEPEAFPERAAGREGTAVIPERAAGREGTEVFPERAGKKGWLGNGTEMRETLPDILKELRGYLGDTPLLVTFRTKREGGEQEISPEAYAQMYRVVLESGMADAIDVELFFDRETAVSLIEAAHASGQKVILSNHDFQKTPPKEELVRRLKSMQELGGDIAKIAVMPQSSADVLILLEATEEAHRKLSVPVVTMSMGAVGVVSRLLGETFGSALTFGMAGQASAPGQVPVEDLRSILQKIHRYGAGVDAFDYRTI
nr:type I 3-dehydroquinate dehydratase [uncultured Marvinbryantia sp.]